MTIAKPVVTDEREQYAFHDEITYLRETKAGLTELACELLGMDAQFALGERYHDIDPRIDLGKQPMGLQKIAESHISHSKAYSSECLSSKHPHKIVIAAATKQSSIVVRM